MNDVVDFPFFFKKSIIWQHVKFQVFKLREDKNY